MQTLGEKLAFLIQRLGCKFTVAISRSCRLPGTAVKHAWPPKVKPCHGQRMFQLPQEIHSGDA